MTPSSLPPATSEFTPTQVGASLPFARRKRAAELRGWKTAGGDGGERRVLSPPRGE